MIIVNFQLVTLIRSAPAEKLVGGGFNSFGLFLLLLLLLPACSEFFSKLPPTNNSSNLSSSVSLMSVVTNCPPWNNGYEVGGNLLNSAASGLITESSMLFRNLHTEERSRSSK